MISRVPCNLCVCILYHWILEAVWKDDTWAIDNSIISRRANSASWMLCNIEYDGRDESPEDYLRMEKPVIFSDRWCRQPSVESPGDSKMVGYHTSMAHGVDFEFARL